MHGSDDFAGYSDHGMTAMIVAVMLIVFGMLYGVFLVWWRSGAV
jgi:hypothetical protein